MLLSTSLRVTIRILGRKKGLPQATLFPKTFSARRKAKNSTVFRTFDRPETYVFNPSATSKGFLRANRTNLKGFSIANPKLSQVILALSRLILKKSDSSEQLKFGLPVVSLFPLRPRPHLSVFKTLSFHYEETKWNISTTMAFSCWIHLSTLIRFHSKMHTSWYGFAYCPL